MSLTIVSGVFCCGAECGIVTAGGNATAPHWTSVAGTVTATAEARRNGAFGYDFATAAASNKLQKTISSVIATTRFAIKFKSLPATKTHIATLATAGSANFLTYLNTTNTLSVAQLSAASDAQPGGPQIVVGQWYVIDFRANTSVNPWKIDWAVNGVAQAQKTSSIAAAPLTFFAVGGCVDTGAGTPTYHLFVDDVVISTASADYPIGDGKVLGYVPNADGVHNAALAFQDNNAVQLNNATTTAWSRTNNVPLTALTPNIQQVVSGIGAYMEVKLAPNVTDGVAPRTLEAVTSFTDISATTANSFVIYLNDNATLSTLFSGSVGATTICFGAAHFKTAPSTGLAWTFAGFNALKARFGYSSDVVPVPAITGLMLEAEWPPSPTPRITNASQARKRASYY